MTDLFDDMREIIERLSAENDRLKNAWEAMQAQKSKEAAEAKLWFGKYQELATLRAQLAEQKPVGKIDYDEEMDRYYIPVHQNWEIQTKGKGSSFRIANTKTGERYLVLDKMLHAMLEQMARDINLPPAEDAKDATCHWRKEDDPDMSDTWASECGGLWSFIDGGPKENDMVFCYKCGKKLDAAIDKAMATQAGQQSPMQTSSNKS